MGVVCPKVGVASKIRTRLARNCTIGTQARSQGGFGEFDRTPLLDQSMHTISIVYHSGVAQSTRASKGKASESLELP